MSAKKLKAVTKPHSSFVPRKVSPKTMSQARAFKAWNEEGKNLVLHGMAGTGKTYTALALALQSTLIEHEQHDIVIMRSAVPTRDLGFLPGNEREKARVYEEPYHIIVNEMFGRGDAYEILKTKGQIDFRTTSYVRGITLDDCIIVVDECQSMTAHELDSIITRVGENSRIIFSGDTRQSDLQKQTDRNGLVQFMSVLDKVEAFQHVEFGVQDVLRSGMVKDYIIAREEAGGYR
jgi:phosphate starvation-inducible protein PhoH and related proteins